MGWPLFGCTVGPCCRAFGLGWDSPSTRKPRPLVGYRSASGRGAVRDAARVRRAALRPCGMPKATSRGTAAVGCMAGSRRAHEPRKGGPDSARRDAAGRSLGGQSIAPSSRPRRGEATETRGSITGSIGRRRGAWGAEYHQPQGPFGGDAEGRKRHSRARMRASWAGHGSQFPTGSRNRGNREPFRERSREQAEQPKSACGRARVMGSHELRCSHGVEPVRPSSTDSGSLSRGTVEPSHGRA